MLINLWNSTCAPCRSEMPLIESFSKRYAGRVAVLGVDYVYVQPTQHLAFAKSVGATYPQVVDLAPAIRTEATPTTILLNASGNIVYQQPIAVTSETQLEQLVRQHLGIEP